MMKILVFQVLSFLVLFNLQAKPGELITISQSVLIEREVEIVFDLVKNTMNDDIWRSEVNSMQASGEFEVGTVYTEDARIGLNKNFITRTQLVRLVENSKAFYVTPKSEPYFLTSLRQVEKTQNGMTKFTYTVQFDKNMSKKAFGINISKRMLKLGYSVIMKQYLRKLKNYLE